MKNWKQEIIEKTFDKLNRKKEMLLYGEFINKFTLEALNLAEEHFKNENIANQNECETEWGEWVRELKNEIKEEQQRIRKALNEFRILIISTEQMEDYKEIFAEWLKEAD